MTDSTPAATPAATATPPAPAPVEVKADSHEDLILRVARIEAHLNINPDVE